MLVLLTLVGGLAATYQQKLAAQAQEHQADAMLQMVLGVLTHSEDMRDSSSPGVTKLISQIADKAANFPADNLRLMRLETAIGRAFVGLSNFGLSDVSKAISHLDRAEAAAISAGASADDLITIRLLLMRKLAANPATAEMALSYVRPLEAAHTEPSVAVRVLALKAAAQLNAKQPQAAVATFEAMLQDIKTAQPPVPAAIVVQARQAYACALRAAGRQAEGLAAAVETARLAEATPEVTATHLSAAMESLGQEYQKSKLYPEARLYFRRAFDLRLVQLGHQHPLTLSAEDNDIRTTELMGQTLESLALRRDQFTLLAEEMGVIDLKVLNRFTRLLAGYAKAGLRSEAEEFISITLAPHHTANGDVSPKATFLLHRVFGFYRDRSDWLRMESAGRTLLKALRQQEPTGLLTSGVQAELARCLSEQGRHAEAAQEAEAVIKVLEPRKAESKEIERKWLPMLRKIIQAASSTAPTPL
jgi:tetratricopeptide (TPR) repeat protein